MSSNSQTRKKAPPTTASIGRIHICAVSCVCALIALNTASPANIATTLEVAKEGVYAVEVGLAGVVEVDLPQGATQRQRIKIIDRRDAGGEGSIPRDQHQNVASGYPEQQPG